MSIRSIARWAGLLASALLLLAAPPALANDEGIVSLTPATGRVQSLDVVAFDVVLDFSVMPALSGGLSISWDPSVFEYVSWDTSTSTVGGDPALSTPPTLNAAAGLLSDATVGNFTIPLPSPGIMATVSLRVRSGASTCRSSIDVLPSSANPWINAATFNTLVPSYRGARLAVGNQTCVAAPLSPDVADMAGRCVGIVPANPPGGVSCPTLLAQHWDVAPLFGDLTVNPAHGIVVSLADHVARYCVYDRKPGVPTSTSDCDDVAAEAARLLPGMMVQPASMAAAVQAGGTSLESLLKQPLQNQFLEQAGPLPVFLNQGNVVQVAIIDTMAFGGNAPVSVMGAGGGAPVPLHGDALRRMVGALISGPDYQWQPGIALPFNCFREQTCLELCGDTEGCVDGTGLTTGYLGTPESVARAIHRAVVTWSASPADTRLVINASLGWRPQFNLINGLPRAGYAAFLDSLTEATCLGALVIAAAGNQNSGPDTLPGMLSPATAGLAPAPTFGECVALGYQPDEADFAGRDRPILYPVGAVDAVNQPVLSRIDGEPPLVAFGDHATLQGFAIDGGELPTLTGSSVASVVVAAAAAAAWSVDTSTGPHELMDTVTNSGRDLQRTAKVCLPGLCEETVRRISVCDAYALRCSDAGLSDCPVCPAPLPTQLDLSDAQLDEIEQFLAAESTRTVSFAGYVATLGADLSPCNGGDGYTLYQSPSAPSPLNPCPQDQFYATLETPWATGQPEHQSCENCAIPERSPAKLLIEIADEFGSELDDPSLLEATLLCRDRASGHVNAFRLPDTDAGNIAQRGFAPGERLLVTDIDNALCPGDDISLAFSVNAGDQQQSDAPASLIQKLIVIRHDEDDDAIPDFRDNCILAADPTQRDTDGDGIGNACDADIAQPNDCIVNAQDLGALRAAFFSTPNSPNWNPDADFDGNGKVNSQDLGVLRASFFGVPGPSAQENACAP